jgi:aspartyl aminopeptidase
MPSLSSAAEHIQDLGAYVSASPSSFHAVHEAARRLDGAGFTGLDELQPWPAPGPAAAGKFYVIRDGALIAWVVHARGCRAHYRFSTSWAPIRIRRRSSSSPNRPPASFGWLQAGVEIYGGPLLNSWLDRELQLAGRLVMLDGTQHLTATGPLLRFPQLAIHLDRAVNEGLTLDKQQHMNPVFGLGDPWRGGPARRCWRTASPARERLLIRPGSVGTTSSSRTRSRLRFSGSGVSSSPPDAWTTSPRRTQGSRR